MRIRRILAAAAALLVAGCAGFIDKPQRPALYDMGPLPQASAGRAGARTPVVLPDIDASGALEGTPVLYRLGYADDHQLRAYSLSRWSASVPQLIRQRLRLQLGRERPVLNPDETAALARGFFVLRLELEEFAHVFDAPGRSRGVLRMRATLVARTPAGERLVEQRSISADSDAPTPDAPGGVRALTAATDAAAAEIGRWLDQVGEAK